MFLLARRYLPRRDAIFAAALYAANPYHIVIVYWRSAFAELLGRRASASAPAGRPALGEMRKKGHSLLGLIVAAAWLTNIPAAVMLTYSLALLLVVAAVMRRSLRPLAIGAMALSARIGSGRVLRRAGPVRTEVGGDRAGVVPGVRPQDNFIFTSLNNPDHDRFNLLISLLSTAEISFWASSGFCHAPGAPAPRSSGGCLRPGRPPAPFCFLPSAFCSIAFSLKCVTCNCRCAGCSA